jgi:hypothetical protein
MFMNCSASASYPSAVAQLFESALMTLRLTGANAAIVSACRQSPCTVCHDLLRRFLVVDLRLSEDEATSLQEPCKRANISDLTRSMKIAVDTFFDYSVVKGNVFGLGVHPEAVCRPKKYCSVLKNGLRWLDERINSGSCMLRNGTLDSGFHTALWGSGGIGSELHVLGEHGLWNSALAGYAFINQPLTWHKGSSCGAVDCLMSPYSPKCYDRLLKSAGGILRETEKFRSPAFPPLPGAADLKELRGFKVETMLTEIDAPSDLFPSSGVPLSLKFWKRVLTTKFQLDHLRSGLRFSVVNDVKSLKLSHPVVSLHVRHGDKFKEMELLELDVYLQKMIPVMHSLGIRNIFLSTEDPAVITAATTNFGMFKWFFTGEQRKNLHFNELSSNASQRFVEGMYNLFAAASCDVFFGTRQSNWNRLIDELQKANGIGGTYYIDVHGLRACSDQYVSW